MKNGHLDLRSLLPNITPDRCHAELDTHRIVGPPTPSGQEILKMLCDQPKGHDGMHGVTINWPAA